METEVILALMAAGGTAFAGLGAWAGKWYQARQQTARKALEARQEAARAKVETTGEVKIAQIAADTADRQELWALYRNTQVLIDTLRRELADEQRARVEDIRKEREHCDRRMEQFREELRQEYDEKIRRKLASQARQIRAEYELHTTQKLEELSEPKDS